MTDSPQSSSNSPAKSGQRDDASYWGSFHIWDRPLDPGSSPKVGPKASLPAPELRPIECVVLGPPGSGKSSWIGALGQAMSLTPGDARALRVIPREQGVALEGLCIESVASSRDLDDSLIAGTGSGDPFVFDIGPVSPAGRLRRVTFIERTLDLEDHYPLSSLALSARAIRCLVICIDGSRDQSAFWHRISPVLLDRLTQMPENDPQRRTPLHQGTAPFDQILFSVTKIDYPCRLALEIPRCERHRLQARGLSWKSAQEIAESLDPVRYVAWQLGRAGFSRLCSIARQNTKLAACMTSASGFHLAYSHTSHLGTRREGEHLLVWHPYGLLDALHFITSGSIEGIVRRVGIRHNTGNSRRTFNALDKSIQI